MYHRNSWLNYWTWRFSIAMWNIPEAMFPIKDPLNLALKKQFMMANDDYPLAIPQTVVSFTIHGLKKTWRKWWKLGDFIRKNPAHSMKIPIFSRGARTPCCCQASCSSHCPAAGEWWFRHVSWWIYNCMDLSTMHGLYQPNNTVLYLWHSWRNDMSIMNYSNCLAWNFGRTEVGLMVTTIW